MNRRGEELSMKKTSMLLTFVLSISMIFSTAVYAADTTATKDIPIGGSGGVGKGGGI